jgi:predicted N-acetyltransferase YhbS
LIIRPETAADLDATRHVNDEAFGEPIEAKLVDAIRASDRYIAELSLVAVAEGLTLGHVISSYVDVEPGARRPKRSGSCTSGRCRQRLGERLRAAGGARRER